MTWLPFTSGTSVPPGTCPTHGYHGRVYCPCCSTSAVPPAKLGSGPYLLTITALAIGCERLLDERGPDAEVARG